MKNKLFPFFVVFLTTFLSSCSTDVEPLHETVVITDPVDGDGDGGGGTSSGDYWPMAVNNQWVYNFMGEPEAPMKIVASEQISGKTYYRYENFIGVSAAGAGFDGTVWTRKSEGLYYVRQEAFIPAAGGNPSITIEPFEIIVLKDFLNVNETWTQTVEQTTVIQGFPQPLVSEIVLNGKIMEKDATITINEQEFTNVIKVELIQNTQGVVNTNYYWFAKDIGLIRYQNVYMGSDVTRDISSYSLN